MAIVYNLDDFVTELQDPTNNFKKKVLVEGDSWTAYPFPDASNLVQCLDETTNDDYLILSLAKSGDTAQNIFKNHGPQMKYLDKAISSRWGDTFDLIFLSAAGNDLIGADLANKGFVRNKKDFPNLHGRELLSDIFYNEVSRVVDSYKRFLTLRDKSAKNAATQVITHCYSYLTPRKKGVNILGHELGKPGWVKRHLEHQNVKDEGEQYEIMCEILDTFYRRMKKIEPEFDHFLIADTRKALLKNGVPDIAMFHDEIHPRRSGYRKVINAIKKEASSRNMWPL